MKKEYDVIISGGGPSGSLLGLLLAKNNIKTLIIEKEKFPRFKICAGGIQYRTSKLLPININSVIENTIYGICFSIKTKDVFIKKYSDPIMFTVERGKFDMLLVNNAKKSGCCVNFCEKVKDYENGNNRIKVITNKDEYLTKILVGADGARGIVHRSLVKKGSFKRILSYLVEVDMVTVEKYAEGVENRHERKQKDFMIEKGYKYSDYIRLDFNGVKKGYAWVFPKKEVLSCGIGVPINKAKTMKEYFRVFLSSLNLSDHLSNSYRIYAQCIPIRNENTPICNYRVLNIGDAACLGDGFTGEGLYNSLKSAIFAVDSIKNCLKTSNYYFKDYRERMEGDIFKDIKMSLLFSKVFYMAPLFFYRIIKKNDNAFNTCCRILRGEKSYKDIASKLKFMGY